VADLGGDDDRHRHVARHPRDPRRGGDRERRDHDRRHRAEEQRQAGDGGDHEAREKGVGKRLGRVGETVEDDPAAERATGDADQDHLDEGALHEGLFERLDHLQ
jgi:hypothetical protein